MIKGLPTKEIESIIESDKKAEKFFQSHTFLKFCYKLTGQYEIKFRMVKLKFHRLELNKRLKCQ